MSGIFTGQRIPLSTAFKNQDGDILNLENATIRYDYWTPENRPNSKGTNAKSGDVPGVVVDAAAGTASGNIPALTNTIVGTWTVQEVAIIGGEEWPACPTDFTVIAEREGRAVKP